METSPPRDSQRVVVVVVKSRAVAMALLHMTRPQPALAPDA